MKRIITDVLVAGAGGAGLMAAITAAERGRVCIVSKGKAGRSGATVMAPGAIAAVGDGWKCEGDSKELHIKDTMAGGAFVNDEALVRDLAEHSPAAVMQLEQLGALFERTSDGGNLMLRIDGGHSDHRCPYLDDRVGKEMVRSMMGGAAKAHIPIYEEIMLVKLLTENGKISGAYGIDLVSGEGVLFECPAVILACGGAGELYANTDNPSDATGDAYALAAEVGAELRDMEFVQFYPIGMLTPPSLRGALGGLPPHVHLYNNKNERFMEFYDKERLELSTRDLVSRAIVTEVLKGNGSPLGGVYCDLTHNEPGFIRNTAPGLYAMYRSCGIDPEKDRFEIAPTSHFFMGGIAVRTDRSTSVAGLFAAGECSGGTHGGNRLSQNALAEVLTSGLAAGKAARKYAATAVRIPAKAPDYALSFADEGISPMEQRRKLQQIMWEHAGVIRSEQSLDQALCALDALAAEPIAIKKPSPRLNAEYRIAAENRNLLLAARAVILSASLRKVSRGAHYRADAPELTENGNVYTDGKTAVWRES